MTQLILVTGATGTVGSEVVKQLVEVGQKVRALARNPAKAARFSGAVEVVKGDLSQPGTLAAAFAGVEKAFVLADGLDLATLEANAFDAAEKAGVKHIVKLSGRSLDSDYMAGTALAQSHNESERRLRDLGVPWTILRPGYFASNMLTAGIKEKGALFLPAGDGKDAPIDPRDVAAVAVKVLTTDGHHGKLYELTGPEMLSYAEMIEKMSSVIGKPLKYMEVTETEARDGMLATGVSPPMADSYLRYYAAVKAGRMSMTSTFAELLGRRARDFDEWLRDNAAALRQ